MTTKEEVINQIITLMKKHSISIDEIQNKLTIKSTIRNYNLKKFFSFLGGIFILSGLGIYIGQHWSEMNSFARIIVTLGTGIALYTLAIISIRDERYEKGLTPLFLLAAFFETFGMFVAVGEFFPIKTDPHYISLLIFLMIFIQQFITFLKTKRTSLLFISILLASLFFYTFFDMLHIKFEYSAVIMGISLMCISYHFDRTEHRSITPLWYFIGGFAFLFGAFDILQNTAYEFFYIGISILIVYLSTIVSSRILLFCGTISLITYIGYFTAKYFVNSIGWPLALILFGLILLGISALAVKINKKIIQK